MTLSAWRRQGVRVTGELTVHAGEELGNDATLHLALGILALASDGVDLVDEQDARRQPL